MSFKRAIAIGLTALAALPAAASAQEQIAPPRGDNYLGPVFLNDESVPFPSDPIGIVADTTNYTTQADMFNPPGSGAPAEPNNCGSPYGNTIWSVFYSNRYGEMNVSTAGPFDSVIAVIPFNSPDDPYPNFEAGFCTDSLTGFEQDTTFLVSPRRWYAIQVGGTGTPQGGQIQVKYDLEPPPDIRGAEAVLSMTGRKVTKFVLKAPKGARVAFKCARKRCGRLPRPFTARKSQLLKLVAGSVRAPKAATRSRVAMRAEGGSVALRLRDQSAPLGLAPAKRSQAVAAKTYRKFLKGKTLPNGTTLEVRITAPGYIGTYYGWQIGSVGIKQKIVRCMNPGSTKPRKRCG